MSDNEGSVKDFLEAGGLIEIDGDSYNIPDDLKFLWGISNDNKPFQGKDFEMANFSNKELANGLGVEPAVVQEAREKGQGINQIKKGLNKPQIARELIRNLFDKYEKTQDQSLFERPIFKVVYRIARLANFIDSATNRRVELDYKKVIKDIFENKRRIHQNQ